MRLGRPLSDGSSVGGGSSTGGSTTFDYYVSQAAGASDTNNGQFKVWTSGQNGPFATFTHALEIASTSIAGTGKTIGCRAGSYDQKITNPVAAGSTWSNTVKLANYGTETVTIIPSTGTNAERVLWLGNGQKYLEFYGLNFSARNFDGTAILLGALGGGPDPHHIRIQNCSIQGRPGAQLASPPPVVMFNTADTSVGFHELLNCQIRDGVTYGLYLAASQCVIDGCEFSSNGTYGIHNYHQGSPSPDGNIIRNSVFHDMYKGPFEDGSSNSALGGIFIAGVDCKVYNNIVYHLNRDSVPIDPNSAGVAVYGTGSSCQIYFNTVVDINGGWGVYLANYPVAVDGDTVRDNILSSCSQGTVFDAGVGTTIDHNTAVDPGFANAAAHDYHLASASGSAYRTGLASTLVTTDKDGIARATPPDLGAYQFVP